MGSDDLSGWWIFLGALVVLVITWHLFWEILQPALVSFSPIFVSNPSGRVGRYPDNPTQAILFATILLGLFVYYLLLMLIFEDITGRELLLGIYGITIILPVAIIKNIVLPRFGIERWEYDIQDDNFQNNETKDDDV
jgi:prepilin signal peptidase PulO-like enzyme (type II secretory pathway)